MALLCVETCGAVVKVGLGVSARVRDGLQLLQLNLHVMELQQRVLAFHALQHVAAWEVVEGGSARGLAMQVAVQPRGCTQRKPVPKGLAASAACSRPRFRFHFLRRGGCRRVKEDVLACARVRPHAHGRRTAVPRSSSG